MKLSGPPPKPMKEFIEERLGVELNIFSYLTGITLDNCHYKDFAVYATWNFDITSKLELESSSKKGKEIDSGSTSLLNHVISIATICCKPHNDRIKGLSINTLVRLFQIMLIRFPEKIMSEFIYTFIFLEGPTKVPNFINHLIELKTFMSMHLSWWLSNLHQQEKQQEKEMALEELRLPVAKYTFIWLVDKDVLSKVDSESAIFIKLIKPTTSSSMSKNHKNRKNQRNRKKQGKNTKKSDNNNKDQDQPSHYYFDSISLSATESPTLTCSFHLPIAFYESHLDWILECNIGSITILPSSNKFTLSRVKQTNDKYFDNWIDFLSSQYNNNESGGEYGWNDEKDESIKNIDDITNDSRECKNCKKVFNIKSGGGTCSKCKSAFYCSKNCQNQDWKRHKKQDCVVHKS
ncbi:5623_t:CDS:1 [Diversispora eburnea]|uniref:5623_t:CDS:1 n=1 Tax=Diversispora eburnea TaxID=1213867 RepID=A0A9N9CP18_9GLOM|nr:5623_t:CDS:1 [Diversispora eburnea]